ncbi:hypothetical protein [Streptomyces sp. BK340]|nr:hypothetical protein [Streptomyces sp. BK340]TVZ77737.1 hypothetical protein FB157_13743 [Streptomyces sp. BK340]
MPSGVQHLIPADDPDLPADVPAGQQHEQLEAVAPVQRDAHAVADTSPLP